jgi:hypothetical protein
VNFAIKREQRQASLDLPSVSKIYEVKAEIFSKEIPAFAGMGVYLQGTRRDTKNYGIFTGPFYSRGIWKIR